MPSLSVCVFSDQPSARLAALLTPLRGVADEIVVAIDDRVLDPRLDLLDGVADSALLLPFEWPMERNLENLHSRCSGDWILRLDGDELPSVKLVEELAGDAWHRGVTHCGITRKWVVDGGTGWIAQNPWFPDVQWRLVRNEPDLLSYSPVVHGVLGVDGPHRVLAAPMYHLDLVDTDLADRRKKARRYLRGRPDLRTNGGLAMGSYYAPELLETSNRVKPVPAEDLPMISAVMAGDTTRMDAATCSGSIQAKVDTSDGRSLSVEATHVDEQGYRDTHLEVLVTIANTGTETIGPSGKRPIRLGAQWTSYADPTIFEEARADLCGEIEPGEREASLMLVRTPSPGVYTLSVGALVEGVEWVARAPSVPFTSIEQPAITVVGGYSTHRHLGDDLIARTFIERFTDGCPDARLQLLANDPVPLQERFGVPAWQDATVAHAANLAEGLVGEASVQRTLATCHDRRSASPRNQIGVLGFADTIRRSDVFVIAAAGSLASRYADIVLWPRLIEAEIAHESAVPVVIASAGFGPFVNTVDREAARRLFTIASRVFLRDQLSRKALIALGVDADKIQVLPDAASGIESVPEANLERFLARCGLSAEQQYLVASVRADDSHEVLSLAAKSILIACDILEAPVVLLPHCASMQLDDRPAMKAIRDMLPDRVDVVELDDIPPDVLAADLVRNAALSVGTRFHNGVLSASGGRPAVIICDTEYDELRARGLQHTRGAKILVVNRDTWMLPKRIRRVAQKKGKPVRTPDPDPATSVILGYTRDHSRIRHPDGETTGDP